MIHIYSKHFVLRVGLILVTVCFMTNSQTNLSAAQSRQANSSGSVTLQVDTFLDNNNQDYRVCSSKPEDCSLRGAITKANKLPTQSYLIRLPAGIYYLTLEGAGEDNNKTGDLDLYGNVTLIGSGIEVTQIDGARVDRVLQIHSQASMIVQWVTITGGQPPNGLSALEMSGGGIFNEGIFTLDAAAVTNNTAGAGVSGGTGGDGGGIYNSGSLTLSSYSNVSNNIAGNGGNSADLNLPGGNGGDGGGIYNHGTLLIQDSSLSGNIAGAGGPGSTNAYGGQKGGDGGYGGGLYSDGMVTIIQSNLTGNTSGNGSGGGDGDTSYCIPTLAASEVVSPSDGPKINAPQSDGGNGGDGGDGGAIYSLNSLQVISTTITLNHAGGGGRGGAGYIFGGTGGGGGDGGGISHQGTLRILHSQVVENQAGTGGDGGVSCYKAGPMSGGGGNGGGIYGSGTFTIEDSLVNNNITGNGGGGSISGGSGGGVFFKSGVMNFLSAQVNHNTSCGGDGGGTYMSDGTTSFVDSQVNNNSITSLGSGGGVIIHQGSAYFLNAQVTLNTSGGGMGSTLVGDFGSCSVGGSGGAGGGINNQGSIYMVNTIIEKNRTGDGGPGLEGDYSCNSGSGGHGGGIYNQGTAQIIYSQVSDNQTGNAGWASSGYGNLGGSGGGLYNAGSLALEYTHVISNTTGDSTSDQVSDGGGGGIYNSGTLSMNGVKLAGNQTGISTIGGYGGGLYLTGNPSALSNLMIVDNQVLPGGKGSGAYVYRTSPDLFHTTLARNTGGDGSGILFIYSNAALTNTILVSQTVGITVTSGSRINLQDVLLGSGAWANLLDFDGSGLISATHILTGDPAFMAPESGDYHIGLGSAALDQGISTSLSTDFDNQLRPNPDTGLPDLGADEYWDFGPISSVTLSGPLSGNIYTPLPISASINPAAATPNVIYIWTPPPFTGQFTPHATFSWPEAGVYTVNVLAMNMDSQVQASQVVTIQAGEIMIYLPVVVRGESSP